MRSFVEYTTVKEQQPSDATGWSAGRLETGIHLRLSGVVSF